CSPACGKRVVGPGILPVEGPGAVCTFLATVATHGNSLDRPERNHRPRTLPAEAYLAVCGARSAWPSLLATAGAVTRSSRRKMEVSIVRMTAAIAGDLRAATALCASVPGTTRRLPSIRRTRM